MGLYNSKLPTDIRLSIPEELRATFAKFNLLCIVRGLRKEQAFAEAIEKELAQFSDDLERNWATWTELTGLMKAKGFSINRTTFWNYRNKGLFADEVRTDGVSTVFDADGILAYYTDGRVTV